MLFSLFEELGRGGDIQEQYAYVFPTPSARLVEMLRNDTAMTRRVSKK